MNRLRASGRAYARVIFVLALVAAAFGTGFASGGYDRPAENAFQTTGGSGWGRDQVRQESAGGWGADKVESLPGQQGCGRTPSSSMAQLERLEQENDQLRRQIAEISLKNSVLRSEANDDH